MPDQPGQLPLELLLTIFSFLPALYHIALCACVSRHWRRAAAQAVPKSVTIDARYSKALLQLLTESCNLGAVESVVALPVEEAGFTQGALFARICAEATCLRDVHLPSEYFHMVALVPVNLRRLFVGGFRFEGNDLAPLARLTQLKVLGIECRTSPLPELPALTEYVGRFTADFQALSNVSATLEHLTVLSANAFDFRQPMLLTRFSRLQTLVLSGLSIREFCPEVLPPSIREFCPEVLPPSIREFCPEMLPPSLRCIKEEDELSDGDDDTAFWVGNTAIGSGKCLWTRPSHPS